MANINASGAIKAKINNDNYIIYPITRIANVDGLQTALDGKAAVNHTHSAFSTTSAGFVPAASSSGDTDKYLKGDGTWATPSGGGGAVSGVKGNAESTYRTGNVNLTPANIGAATSDHTHGNITNDGKLQTTDVSIASGDKLVITDSSDSSKIARASVSFDGSTTTQFLSKKGTWETPSGGGVTGVKGSNESSYRTGNVSLSYSNVGAAASSHSHSDYVKQAYYTSNKTSGSLNDLSEGRVYCSSNCTNLPVSANMMVETLVDYNGSYKTQRAEVISGSYAGHVFSRYYNGSWSSWIDLTSPTLLNYSLDNGVRNILDLNDIYFKHSTISYSADIALGKIVCSGTGTYLRIMYNVKLKAGAKYKLAWTIASISTTDNLAVFATTATNAGSAISVQTNCTSTGNYTYEFTAPSETTYICFYLNISGVSRTVAYTITNMMLAEKEFFPSSFYQSAKSNSELTAIVDSLLSRVKALEGN